MLSYSKFNVIMGKYLSNMSRRHCFLLIILCSLTIGLCSPPSLAKREQITKCYNTPEQYQDIVNRYCKPVWKRGGKCNYSSYEPCLATWCVGDQSGIIITIVNTQTNNENGQTIEDPIVISTGEFVKDYEDLSAEGKENDFKVLRHYGNQHISNVGLGNGWDSSLFPRLSTDDDENVDLTFGDGKIYEFNNMGGYYSSPSPQITLVRSGDNCAITDLDGDKYYYTGTNIQSRVNSSGIALYWEYDGARVTGLRSDPGGGVTRLLELDWDTNLGVVTKIRDVRPDVTRSIAYEYSHDINGVYLTRVSGACASCVDVPEARYTYHSGSCNLDEIKDAYNNNQIKVYYDGENRVVTQIRAYDSNYACTATFARSNGLVNATDFTGNTAEYYVNPNYYITKQILKTSIRPDEGDYIAEQEWTETNLKTKVVYPNGRIVGGGFNSNAQMANYILFSDSGNITHSTYEYDDFDSYGMMTRYVDADGSEHLWSFDAKGRATRHIYNPSNGAAITRLHEYDDVNNRVTRATEEGIVQVYHYDDLGRLTKKTTDSEQGGGGAEERYEVDALGHTTKSIDANGNVYQKFYGSANLMTKAIGPDGIESDYSYDDNGRITYVQSYNPSGGVTRVMQYLRDSLGRVTKSIAPGSETSEFLYDGLDRVTWTKQPDGTEYKTVYDERDHIYLKLVYDSGNWVTKNEFYYDGEENLTKLVNADGELDSENPHFDDYGRMTREEYSAGYYNTYDYDITGNVTREITYDKDNNALLTKCMVYDKYGRVTRETDALGNYRVSEYDDGGRITRTIEYTSGNSAVSEMRTEYDGAGRSTRTRRLANPGGSISTTSDDVTDTYYDDLGQVTKKISYLSGDESGTPVTLEETYAYDSGGRLLTRTFSDGPTVAREYDGLGQLTREITDPPGLAIATSYEYDSTGHLTRTTGPDGCYTVPSYNSGGRITLNVVYNSGNTAIAASSMLYDLTLGQVTKVYQISDPANRLTFIDGTDPCTESVYTSAGRLTKTIDPTGNATTYEYDSYGRQVTIADAASNKNVTIYDAAGRMATSLQLDYDGTNYVTFVTANEYDSMNRVTRAIQQGPDGDIASTADNLQTTVWFDALGRQTLVQDPRGTQTAFAYDALGRLTRKTEDFGQGRIERYSDYAYNRSGWMTRQTGYTNGTSGAQTTDYAYNNAGAQTRVTYPDDNIPSGDRGYVELFYDAAGRLVSKVDQEGQAVTLAYDTAGRILTQTKGTEIDAFGYTALGQLNTAQRGVTGNLDSVSKVERFYDGLGRLTRETQTIKEGTTRNVDYAYDKNGNVLTLGYPGGEAVQMSYDANRLDMIKRDGNQLADYDYAGYRVKNLTYETGTNDVAAARNYDGAGRMTRLAWSQTSNTLPDFTFTYDAAGNILTKTHNHRAGTPAEAYDIDDLYRLTDARYDFRVLTHGFTYDDLGNQLTFAENAAATAELYNEVNELTSYDGQQIYYDKNGNLTKGADGYTYHYDRQNQVTGVKKTNDTVNVAGYAYDALGRRIEFIDSGNTVTKQFYHDGDRVIEERDADGNRQRYYVWGNYIDELLVMNDDAGDNADYVVCHDQLSSPHALLAKSDGSIIERFDYDAYGKPVIYTEDGGDSNWWDGDETTAAVSGKGLAYLFTGREYDALDDGGLSLQYSRARYYSPTLRRWMQRDPAGSIDGENSYQYVESQPISVSDPMGLWKFDRSGLPKAIAESDVYWHNANSWWDGPPDWWSADPITSLGGAIGLNFSELTKWAKFKGPGQKIKVVHTVATRDGGAVTGHIHEFYLKTLPELRDNDEICPKQKFEIPNTVLAYWGGWKDEFGKDWVMWPQDIATLRKRGFRVDEKDMTSAAFLGYLRATTVNKTLHGIYFWGHGGFSLYTRDIGIAGTSAIPASRIMRNLKYRLALGILWGCKMMDNYSNILMMDENDNYIWKDRQIFTKHAIVEGGWGLFAPLPSHRYGRTVEQIIPPGAQGTRK